MKRVPLGQVLSATAVVLSLGFVGYELRQNAAVARGAAYQAFVTELNDIYSVVNSDAEYLEMSMRIFSSEDPGRAEFERLARFKLTINLLASLRLYESLHLQVEEGVLPPESLRLMSGSDWDNRFTLETWPNIRRNFGDRFVEHFEEVSGFSEADS